MGYYQVLGLSESGCCYKYDYSYLNNNYHYTLKIKCVVILKSEDSRIHKLILRTIPQGKFDNESTLLITLGYYSIEECSDKELSNITHKPLNKGEDIIFIVEGADIHNHLFSVSKYGNEDKPYYTGEYKVYPRNWLRLLTTNSCPLISL